MDAVEVLSQSLTTADGISGAYLQDLTDGELLVRPLPDANHIAWQLGHLIATEHSMLERAFPGCMPGLPDDFSERHAGETAREDAAEAFLSKQAYLDLFQQQRAATRALLEGLTAADLDAAAPEELRGLCKTVADVFAMQAAHWLMHAGQWAVIRRKLGRPPLF